MIAPILTSDDYREYERQLRQLIKHYGDTLPRYILERRAMDATLMQRYGGML